MHRVAASKKSEACPYFFTISDVRDVALWGDEYDGCGRHAPNLAAPRSITSTAAVIMVGAAAMANAAAMAKARSAVLGIEA